MCGRVRRVRLYAVTQASDKRKYLDASTTPDAEQAVGDLHEVAECVRSLLAVSSEPAALSRLYRMHKDIQHCIEETQVEKPDPDFDI